MNLPKLEEVKKQAKELTALMKQQDPNFKLANSYEAIAKALGYKDWNTLCGLIKKDLK